MEFIAEDPVHVVIRNEVPALVDGRGGIVRPAERRLFAKFSRGTAPGWAREIGLEQFEMLKAPESGVTAGEWLSYYDTVEAQQQFDYTDEEREAIEKKLQRTAGVVKVERPRLPAPWPAYDTIVARFGFTLDQVAGKIASKVDEDGYSASDVIAYERENHNRTAVIAALEQLLDGAEVAEAEPQGDEELIEA